MVFEEYDLPKVNNLTEKQFNRLYDQEEWTKEMLLSLEEFMETMNVDKPSPGYPCIQRLKGNSCTYDHKRDNKSFCEIPYSDHTTLWLRENRRPLYLAHIYSLSDLKAKKILDFCYGHGFKVTFSKGLSYYFLGKTTAVMVENDRKDHIKCSSCGEELTWQHMDGWKCLNKDCSENELKHSILEDLK